MRVVNTNSTFAITFPDGTSTSASQSNSYFIYDGARYRILAGADGIVLSAPLDKLLYVALCIDISHLSFYDFNIVLKVVANRR